MEGLELVNQDTTVEAGLLCSSLLHKFSLGSGVVSGHLMFALKAARDAVNTRPQTPGHLLIVGTGSHKSRVTDMATRRS